MTTEQDKAVALAEKHGASIVSIHPGKSILLIGHQLTAMLADHRQQVIEELAGKTGVMPKPVDFSDVPEHANVWGHTPAQMREAIAAMQAWVEISQDSAKIAQYTVSKLQARVEQLENALETVSKHSEAAGIIKMIARAAMKGASK